MRLFPMLLVVVLSGVAAFAQDTQPAPDLARENQKLKDRVAQLEARVKELEAKLRAAQPRVVPAPAPLPFPEKPFQMPRVPEFHFNVPEPSTRPYIVPAPTPQNVPPDWHRYQFNGQDVYLIPLR